MKQVLLEELLKTGHLEAFIVGYLNNDRTVLESLW